MVESANARGLGHAKGRQSDGGQGGRRSQSHQASQMVIENRLAIRFNPSLPSPESGAPKRSPSMSPRSPRSFLSQDATRYIAIDVRQAKVAAGMAVGQPLVVESERVKQRRMQVVHMHGVFDGEIP